MKFFLVFAVAGFALAQHPDFDNNDQPPVNRIVGGVEVQPPGKYPFMVQLPVGCGGSLISPNWVLTACHCVEGDEPADIGPVWLERHLSNSGGISVDVTQAICHPSYPGRNESDTALLRISPAINHIRPIPLDSGKGICSQPGELNTVIGWGLTSFPGNASDTLQEVSLPVITNVLCAQVMDEIAPISENDICLGVPEGGKGTCFGDSGSPMFYQQNADNFCQTGVVSWGVPCARENRYDVFARVSTVLDWIVEHVPDATII